MASVKINAAQKSMFANHMAVKVFRVHEAEFKKRIEGYGDKLYEAAFTKKQIAFMEQGEPGMFNMEGCADFHVSCFVTTPTGSTFGRSNLTLEFSKPRPVMHLVDGTHYNGLPQGVFSVKAPSYLSPAAAKRFDKLKKEIRGYISDFEAAIRAANNLESEIKLNLKSIRTLDALKQSWPEIYDDFIEVVKPDQRPQSALPAIAIGNLNAQIEQAKKMAAKQEKAKAKEAA